MRRRADSAAADQPAGDTPDGFTDQWRQDNGDADGREWRSDLGELLRASIRIDAGRLLIEGIVAKPGILEYPQPDGTVIRELIPADELHNADSLLTLAQAPLTLEHPDRPVGPDNVGQLVVGNVGDDVEIVKDNGFVRVKMVVRRADALDDIQSRRRTELSPGYTVRIDHQSGIDPEFGPFDQIQRDRRYNHLAITEAARGGREIRLRADAAYHLDTHAPEATMNLYQKLLAAMTTGDGALSRADAEAILAPLKARADADTEADKDGKRDDGAINAANIMQGALVAAFDAMTSKAATLQGKVDALQVIVDAAKGDMEHEEDENNHDALISFHQDRTALELLATANKLDPTAADVLKLDNAGLRRAIVAKMNPALRADADDKYVLAYLDVQAQTRKDGKRSSAFDSLSTDTTRNDGGGADDPDNKGKGRDDADPGWLKTMGDAFNIRKGVPAPTTSAN